MEILWFIGAALLLANIFVSFNMIQNLNYSSIQKLSQAGIVWFVPILGAALVWNLLQEQRAKRHTKDTADRLGQEDGGDYWKSQIENTPESGGGDGGGGD